jgi:hypothetical protein
MARGPHVTRQERDEIIGLLKSGKSANSIAKSTGRSRDTVCRIAAESGHVFGKTNEEKARARSAYCSEARERLRLGLLSEAERLMAQLRDPQKIYAFMGGRDGAQYMERELAEPEPKAKQHLLTAIGIAIDKAELIERNNTAGNDDGRGAMLALLEAMGVKRPEET